MQAATIKLFLVHGSPNGLRTAELSNWSGKAIAAPRTELPEILKREELRNPGFYLLTGVDSASGDRAIYIGEAEGVTDFNKTVGTDNEEELLYCKVKGLVATGKRTANGFVVFAGSQAVFKHLPSASSIRAKREELIGKGHLKQEGEYLAFVKDIEFGSPSTAGSVVRGGNTNGLTHWKNSAGMQLKEIEANKP